jgi:parallel beta-helix repeat protein
VAIGASDAGIYVGQSTNVVVRKCKAMKNVAGIEIENCVNAEAYDNEATDNAGGFLVFDLPGLQLKNGRQVKVHNNNVHDNNHVNFAPAGNIVATVAPGTGMMVMATDQVEFANNTIKDNKTYGLIIVSYLITGKPVDDKEYDPYPEAVYIHDNTIEGNGKDPAGPRAPMLIALLGKPMPEIIYDGMLNPKKLVDGKMPEDQRVVLKDNGKITAVNLHWDQIDIKDLAGAKAKVEWNPKSLVGEHPALPSVKLAEVK